VNADVVVVERQGQVTFWEVAKIAGVVKRARRVLDSGVGVAGLGFIWLPPLRGNKQPARSPRYTKRKNQGDEKG
jgi:hypothetical protein